MKSIDVSKQSGQALTEFLVIAVAMVPLFLLLPMIGKYQDLAHATQMASRYAAFDATIFGNTVGYNPWKPPAQLADEIRRRYYGNANAPVKTGDVAGEFDADRNLAWRDPYGNALIRNFGDVAVSFGNNAATQASGFEGAADGKPFNAIPLATASKIGLPAPGVYTANVSVGLANLPSGINSIEPFDTLDLSIRRHTSLLFDPWSAPDTERTEDRVERLAPLNAALSAVSPVIDLAVFFLDMGKVDAPKFGNLKAWRDVVPADRLVSTTPPASPQNGQ
ncbi:MAG: hypothetical protein V4695_12180 [Pseudomonadota bacterium]